MLSEILSLTILILGVVALVAGGGLLIKTLAESTAATSAEVVSAELESYQQGAKDGLIDTFHRGRYRLRYTVSGKIREAIAGPAFGIADAKLAQKRVEAHPPGSVHKVRYELTQPSSLILDSRRRPIGFALLLTAIGVALLGAAAVIYFASQSTEW